MKKIYTLIFSLLLGFGVYANPIALPNFMISELYFDHSDNWKLELVNYAVDQTEYSVDSVYIYSTSDTVKLPLYEFMDNAGVFVYTKDSLSHDFVIKRYADTLTVVSSVMGLAIEDRLMYGNFSNSPINYPREGQSICRYGRHFVKDNSPTIGVLNDTIGICGTLKGIMYDKYSGTVDNRSFYIDNLIFETLSNGEFEARVLAKPTVFNSIIYQWIYQGTIFGKSASLTEISYVMEPDSVIEMDIHLKDTLASGINDNLIENAPIQFYPNPIAKNEILNIHIDLPIFTSDIFIEIIDLNGKLIRKEKINQYASTINVPSKGGFYIVRAWLDSQIISSKKILVND